jgi:hypothetical protein
MKTTLFLPSLLALVVMACQPKPVAEETPAETHEHPTPTEEAIDLNSKKSIPREVHAMANGAHITLTYHSPGVRERTIWGGLVPYGEVWVTGAHKATTFEIDKSFTLKGTRVEAGKYAIFTIPGKEEFIVIINKNWDQHLADDYDSAEDVVRVPVPVEYKKNMVERLEYAVVETSEGAELSISWEYVHLSLPLGIIP